MAIHRRRALHHAMDLHTHTHKNACVCPVHMFSACGEGSLVWLSNWARNVMCQPYSECFACLSCSRGPTIFLTATARCRNGLAGTLARLRPDRLCKSHACQAVRTFSLYIASIRDCLDARAVVHIAAYAARPRQNCSVLGVLHSHYLRYLFR